MSDKIKGYCWALLIILFGWHLFALFLAKPFFPLPHKVLGEFIHNTAQGRLVMDFVVSSLRVFASLALSFFIAVPLGLVIGRTPALDRIASPVLYLLYPLPKVAFLPLIIVLLGLGNTPKVMLIALVVFFQILITARDASRGLPRQWALSMRSLHASRWQVYCHLVWPACLPRIFTALRISLGTAIAVLFFAETFASVDGLGFFILEAMEKREFSQMYAGILAMGLMGAVSYSLLDLLENRFCRWSKL